MRSLLTPWLVIPAALAAMALTMWTAVRLDCERIEEEREEAVRVVDSEMKELERRWIAMVPKDPFLQLAKSPLDGFGTEKTPLKRHSRFRRIVQIAGVPKSRADELNGIFNRWEIIEEDYRARAAELAAFINSWRGKMAGRGASAGDVPK